MSQIVDESCPVSQAAPLELEMRKMQALQPVYALSPEQYAAKLNEICAEAAELKLPFTESNAEQDLQANICFLYASAKENTWLIFQCQKGLDLPHKSACILAPDWPRAHLFLERYSIAEALQSRCFARLA